MAEYVVIPCCGAEKMIPAKTFRFMLSYARTDPLGFADMLRRRIVEQFSTPPLGVAQTQFSSVKYEVDMSIHQLMKKYYYHTHEMFLERIFDQFLAPGSTFIDIGANCGYWSGYALSRIGREGQVHAFEPVPQYFAFVRRLAELNPGFNLIANNVACGSASGRSCMAVVLPRTDNFGNSDTNIGSSSLVSGFLDHAKGITENIDVGVIAFDDYIRSKSIDLDNIGLIKIDVEGFEEFCSKWNEPASIKDWSKGPYSMRNSDRSHAQGAARWQTNYRPARAVRLPLPQCHQSQADRPN